MCACFVASAVPASVQCYGLQPARLLCPQGSPRQEYWSGLPCPPQGDLPDPGIKLLATPVSSALQPDFFFFTTEPPRKPSKFTLSPTHIKLTLLTFGILPFLCTVDSYQ